MPRNRQPDVELENGAEVNFKIGKDVAGNIVITHLQIGFDSIAEIPIGGIGAAQLREVSINHLLSLWYQESSKSYLSKSQEFKVWEILRKEWPKSGRTGLPEIYYACLAYMYISYCEEFPSNPTSELASKLQIKSKTLSTQLGQSRKKGMLSIIDVSTRKGRAYGEITPKAKKEIATLLRSK